MDKTQALEAMAKLVIVGTQRAIEEREIGGTPTMVWTIDTGDGRRVWVYAMLLGNARLCIGDPESYAYDEGYCYDGVENAIIAAVEWIAAGATGEPADWKKNLQTGEYREP